MGGSTAPVMIAQMRVYTINRGQVDAWLKIFHDEAMPLIRKHGMGVDGMWTDLPQERFIWFRTYEDEADMKRKDAAFYGDPEWLNLIDRIRAHEAYREITIVKPVTPSL